MRPVRRRVIVRRATADDADLVLAMVLEIAAHEGDSQHVHVTADTWHQLLQRPDVVVLLAEHGGQPVGYVSGVRQLHLWSGRDILALDDLSVRQEFRDAGAGRRLMTAFAAVAASEQLLCDGRCCRTTSTRSGSTDVSVPRCD